MMSYNNNNYTLSVICAQTFMQANYGRKDPECVQRVKDTYRGLNLEEVYCEYEEKSYARLLEKIAELHDQSLPGRMFQEILARYTREIPSSCALVVYS